MQNLQSPDSTPASADVLASKPEHDEYSVYDDIEPAPGFKAPVMESPASGLHSDAQDSYFETREPSELVFCIILAAAYAGLARFCWEPLESSGQWMYFVTVEGFFITIAMLSIVLGLRPYISPSGLQISQHGIKYRGPYWPQRRTVNWDQIFRLYLSPELIIIFHRPPNNPKGVRLLFIQSSYLSDRDNIVASFAKYALVQPVYLKNPDWYIKAVFLTGYLGIVCWILTMLQGK
jgi:hypothetical protein